MKKYLQKLLLLAAVLLCVTVFAGAAEVIDSGYCGGEGDGTNLTWTLTDDGVLTIEGTGAMKGYLYHSYGPSPWYANRNSIQTVQIGDSVTTIGEYAFYGCDSLTEVAIGDSVTTIGYWAFYGCDSLTAVTIPDSVTTIGEGAFDSCFSLTAVTIGDSVTTIGNYAFEYCISLTAVTIPDSVTTIGYYAFDSCNRLTAVTIPNSVTTIGPYAFERCSSLTTVTIGDSVTTIGDDAFSWCSSLTSVTIGDSVTTIGYAAFSSCSRLATVTIPDSVTTIGNYAFERCSSLTTVTIGDSVTWICGSAFTYCNSLTEVTFEGKAPSFGQDVFYGVTATCYYPANDSTWTSDVMQNYGGTLTWEPYETTQVVASGYCGGEGDGTNLTWKLTEDGVLIIEGTGDMDIYSRDDAPWRSKRWSVKSVQIGDGVTSVSHFAFYDCINLTEAEFGAGVTGIGNTAFTGCGKLNSITVSADNQSYSSADGVLYNKDKTKLIIYPAGNTRTAFVVPATVTEIITCAFDNCEKLTSVTIGDSVTNIGSAAFRSCDNLASVTIGDRVTTIGDQAFLGCTGLKEIVFTGHAPSVGQNAFFQVTATCTYPGSDTTWTTSGVKQNHGGNLTWKGVFSGICGDNLTWTLTDDGVLTIDGTGAMYDYANGSPTSPWYLQRTLIQSVSIGSGVTTIGKFAFYGCENLTEVTIPANVTAIGEAAFSLCSSMTAIHVAAANPSYSSADGVLFNKAKTELIQYPIGNTRASYTVPAGVTTLGYLSFYKCSSLTAVTIPDSVTTIGEYAFSSCSNLASVTMGDHVTTIGNAAFVYCTGLTSVTLPDSVTSIGDSSFAGCTGLTEVTIPANVSAIGVQGFRGCTGLKEIVFTGNAPSIASNTFYEVTATCIYPGSDTSWAKSGVKQNYGGNLTWKGVFSGICGDNLTWDLTDGVLTITGTGEMYDYTSGSAPWYEEKDSIRKVIIENGATTIGDYAFADCGSLTSVTIPDTVTAIGDYAFYGSGLMSVTIPGSVLSVGESAFENCLSLSYATISQGVTAIGASAFARCTALSGVIIPESVTNIGEYAFSNCTGLMSVTLPSGLTAISPFAFAYCGSLKTVAIPDSVGSIGEYAFAYCSSLTTVRIPVNTMAIGHCAFSGCTGLSSITVAEGNNSFCSVDGVLFNYAKTKIVQYPIGNSRTTYEIPAGVNSIGYAAFAYCNLTAMTIPEHIASISDYAFSSSSLTEVRFECTKPSIAGNAFQSVTATCSYPAKDTTWTAAALAQNYGGTLTWKPYSVLAEFYGASMTLGNNLRMNFYILQNLLPQSGLVASITRNGVETRIPMEKWETTGSYYRIIYSDIAAKEITDDLVVVILDENGTPVSEERHDGVQAYAMRFLNREDTAPELMTALVDLLQYGAFSQRHFNYRTDDLADAQLTAAHLAFASKPAAMENLRTAGKNYYGTSLSLEDHIVLNFYFRSPAIGKTAKVTYTDHYGTPHSYEIPVVKNGSFGQVVVNTLVVADARQLVTVEIYDGETLVASAVDSVESYCARNADTLDLCQPLMNFAQAAYNQFH